MEQTPDIIEALTKLVEVVIRTYGPGPTLAISFLAVAAIAGWRIYQQRRKDKEVHLALQEKDRTIQRLAEQERSLRALLFKQLAGWDDETVERFILRNEFPDPESARKALEQEATRPTPSPRKKRR
jgi:hypothetical protein